MVSGEGCRRDRAHGYRSGWAALRMRWVLLPAGLRREGKHRPSRPARAEASGQGSPRGDWPIFRVGISDAINFLNPEVVVLGSSTVEVGEMAMTPLTRVAKKRRCLGWRSG